MSRRVLLISLIVFGLFGARRAAAVTIADVLANPDKYDGTATTLTGEVERAIPAGSESGYNLRDGAARITVISRNSAPAVGTRLIVTGTVRWLHQQGDGGEAIHFPPFLIESQRRPAP